MMHLSNGCALYIVSHLPSFLRCEAYNPIADEEVSRRKGPLTPQRTPPAGTTATESTTASPTGVTSSPSPSPIQTMVPGTTAATRSPETTTTRTTTPRVTTTGTTATNPTGATSPPSPSPTETTVPRTTAATSSTVATPPFHPPSPSPPPQEPALSPVPQRAPPQLQPTTPEPDDSNNSQPSPPSQAVSPASPRSLPGSGTVEPTNDSDQTTRDLDSLFDVPEHLRRSPSPAGAFNVDVSPPFITPAAINYLQSVRAGQRWTDMVTSFLRLEGLPAVKAVSIFISSIPLYPLIKLLVLFASFRRLPTKRGVQMDENPTLRVKADPFHLQHLIIP